MSDAKVVVGVLSTPAQAEVVVSQLHAAGFPREDISAVLPDTAATRNFAFENNTKAPEGAVAGGMAGGALGGTLGLLAGIGALAIPGLGPFIAAGPIMAALSGAAAGAAVGGVAGSLVGLGIPELEAKEYEGKLRTGSTLLSVHTRGDGDLKRAKAIFENGGVADVLTVPENAAHA